MDSVDLWLTAKAVREQFRDEGSKNPRVFGFSRRSNSCCLFSIVKLFYVYVFMSVWVHTLCCHVGHEHMHVWPEVSLLSNTVYLSFEKGLSLVWDLLDRQGWLTSKHQGSTVFVSKAQRLQMYIANHQSFILHSRNLKGWAAQIVVLCKTGVSWDSLLSSSWPKSTCETKMAVYVLCHKQRRTMTSTWKSPVLWRTKILKNKTKNTFSP